MQPLMDFIFFPPQFHVLPHPQLLTPSFLQPPSFPPYQPGYLSLHEQPGSQLCILTPLHHFSLSMFAAPKQGSVLVWGQARKIYVSSFPPSLSLPPAAGPAAGARCPLPAAAAWRLLGKPRLGFGGFVVSPPFSHLCFCSLAFAALSDQASFLFLFSIAESQQFSLHRVK